MTLLAGTTVCCDAAHFCASTACAGVYCPAHDVRSCDDGLCAECHEHGRCRIADCYADD